jgi:hypothetical protein
MRGSSIDIDPSTERYRAEDVAVPVAERRVMWKLSLLAPRLLDAPAPSPSVVEVATGVIGGVDVALGVVVA